MSSSQSQFLTVSSLRGGLSDNEPPLSLPNDACVLAENVEFFYSTLGERRLGCAKIDLPASITGDSNIQAVTWLGRHLPTNNLGDAELWALAQHTTAANQVLTRRTQTAWSTVSPIDAITTTSGYGHKLFGVSLHGKFFIAHKSAVDFLHVWDGSALRQCGMPAPGAAPTGVNTGSGSYASTRYFRVRYVAMSGSTVLRRGEPSAVLTFTPSGSGTGVVLTKPAGVGQNETHWEIEASTDNANFYRIARQDVATTTYTDSTAFATGYASGTLSEALTAYTQIPSGKFLSVDSDRLLIAGSWENSTYASRVWWTPVLGDIGNGNDERLDMTVNPYMDLDGYEGGEITGISRAINGYIYVYKWSHIYKIIRTGQRTNAYTAVPITKARGAFPGSLVEAVDQAGNPAQYFLDPKIGPMRVGTNGLEWCGKDVRTLWNRVNTNATVPAHGVFYQSKNQVHFWLALDGADYPNAKIIVHCDQMQSGPNGALRGWVTVPVGNRIADAHCSIMFSDNVNSTTDIRSQNLVPFIGKQQWSVSGSTIKDLIQQCDQGTTDAYTTGDTSAYYYAKVTSKPFVPTGLLNKHGIMAGAIIMSVVDNPANNLYIELTKNFGLEVLRASADMKAYGTEQTVIRNLDSLSFSELTAVQLTMGDLDTTIHPSTNWRVHAFSMKIRPEQTS